MDFDGGFARHSSRRNVFRLKVMGLELRVGC